MKDRTLVSRGAIKRIVDRALGRFGARILTGSEEQAFVEGRQRMIAELVSVYEEAVFPDLEPREGRLKMMSDLIGISVSEAIYLLHYLQGALGESGDVCEMGVAQGATSALLASELLESDRTLWLYDSFQGLSDPTAEDVLIDDMFKLGSMDRYARTMAVRPEQVQERLNAVGFPSRRVRIVPGFIRPDLSTDQLPAEVAFAFIDFDLYKPILTALELMHPRCRAGSVLMVDDYGFFSTGVETAVEQFLATYPEQYDLLEPPATAGKFCALRHR